MSRLYFRAVLLVVIYLFSACLLTYCFVTRGSLFSRNFTDDSDISFSRAIYWTAPWPYVYRVLMPATVRAISDLTPEKFKESINRAVEQKPFFQRLGWTTAHTYECLVAIAIIYWMWIGIAFMWRHLIRYFYDCPGYVSDLAPAFGLLILPAFFLSNYTVIYDPMTLFMFLLGVVLIVARKRRLYYIFFPLAVLNKFTALVLTGLFLVRDFRTVPNRRLLLDGAAQVLIWAIIVAGLVFIFKGNARSLVYFVLFWNISFYTSPTSIFHALYSFCFFAVFAFLIFYHWRQRPVLLRRLFGATALIFLPAVLLFGAASHELRVWYELYPLAFLLGVGTVCNLFDIDCQPAGVQ